MYRQLTREIPDVDALLALSPEELGLQILKVARDTNRDRSFAMHPTADRLTNGVDQSGGYPFSRFTEAERAIAEALAWLVAEGLFVRDPGQSATFVFVSRRGQTYTDPTALAAHLSASRLLKATLLPTIRDRVWLAFSRGEYDVAVLHAMKQVEISVRAAAGAAEDDVGVPLCRTAFAIANKGKAAGPLTDTSRPIAEQEARQHLFAGALGSYKNPQSHRHVDLTDPDETLEQILLANHLLRIVEALG